MRPRAASGFLRKPSQLKQGPGSQGRQAQTTSKPAPVGGWNARDSVAAMDEKDAIIMRNWFPKTGSVAVRDGYSRYVTGITGQVESLMVYNSASGAQQMYGSAGTSFYNVSSQGAVGAAVVTGLTNARWQHTNFTNTSAISYLCCFNGIDKPRYWDGTTWLTIDAASTPAITGVTTTTLNNPWVFKRRMWMVQKNTLSAWYLPVDAVGGAATQFSLYGIFKRGGYLVAGSTWTIDAGDGLDDFIVFVSSEGEVVVYQGTDPASFVISGRWDIAEPIGDRCLMKFGGDLLMITTTGVYPLSRALTSSSGTQQEAITNKIEGAMSAASASYKTNYGWSLLHDPESNMLLLNVPVREGSQQEQYVMNTITGAWAQFQNLEANCWTIFNKVPYFGANGYVALFGQSLTDNGSNIQADVLPAFSFFNALGALKHFKMIRPIIATDGAPALLAALNVDFSTDAPSSPLSSPGISFAVWDAALWDAALWGGDSAIVKQWQSVANVGTSASLRLLIACSGIRVELLAVDYVYEIGGVV